MANITMPQLGQDVTEATVSRWLKKEGDAVKKGEPVAEVMTEKVSREVESPEDGVISRIAVAEGATVAVNTVLAEVSGAGGGASPVAVPAQPASASAQAPPVPVSPTPVAPVGTPPAPAGPAAPAPAGDGDRVFTSPAARRLARELGVDVMRVRGSGPGGRVVERDVQKAAEERRLAPAAAAAPAAPMAPAPAAAAPTAAPAPAAPPTVAPQPAAAPSRPAAAAGQTIAVTGLRKIIADRMMQSQKGAAHVTITSEVDMAESVKLRTQLVEEWEKKHGIRTSYTEIIARSCAKALREHPRVNSAWGDNQIRLLDKVNVGIAVALENGLIVPNIKDADQKSILELGRTIRDLGERARANRLAVDEVTGGTFTITNLGMYGTDSFTPIPNPPECAILGVGRIVDKPVAREGQVVIRPMMWLSLTFDHRIVDGAPAAQFLRRVQEILEKPYLLFV